MQARSRSICPRPPSSSTSTCSSATSPGWRRGRARPASACGPTPRPTSAPRSRASSARRGPGACPLAKVGEAEVFADAGFDDLFVAYPVVGEDKGRRLLALADRARLAVGVDSVEGARTPGRPVPRRRPDSRRAAQGRRRATGASASCPSARSRWRAGDRGAARACACAASSRTPATATSPRRRARVEEIARQEGERLAATAADLRAAGLPVEEVSVGSTPTAAARDARRRRHRVPSRQLRLPRRLPGRPRHLRGSRTAPSRSWPPW